MACKEIFYFRENVWNTNKRLADFVSEEYWNEIEYHNTKQD